MRYLVLLCFLLTAARSKQRECKIHSSQGVNTCDLVGNFYVVGKKFYVGTLVTDIRRINFSYRILKHVTSDVRYARLKLVPITRGDTTFKAILTLNGVRRPIEGRVVYARGDDLTLSFHVSLGSHEIPASERVLVVLKL